MSTRLTWSEVEAHNAKVFAGRYGNGLKSSPEAPPEAPPEPFDGPEEELCQMIIKECERRHWYWNRNQPGKRSTSKKGATDFTIAAPPSTIGCECQSDFPMTYWIEVKRKGNTLSDEQVITKNVLLALGHRWACVYSFSDFLKAIE